MINRLRHSFRSMIDLGFPGAKKNYLGLEEQRQGSVVFMDESLASSTSVCTGGESVCDMQESVLGTEGSSSDSKMSRTVPIRSCLILTFSPEQEVAIGWKQHVKIIFSTFNYNVEVVRCREKDSTYILVFDNEEEALNANAELKSFWWKLSKYRPRRPSRDNPVSYKVIHLATVRVGKSLSSRKIGMLEKNDIIRVNQVKGRRARIISSLNGPQVGWVSLHSVTGEQLLERCQQHIRIYD